MRATCLILVLAVTSSACYQYTPIDEAAPLPEPGAEVRAQLADPQPLELGAVTVHDVSRIEGDVFRSEGDTVALFSRRIVSAYGNREYTNGAVFYFERSQLRRIEQLKLAPVRSGIAAGAITAGIAAMMYFALDLGGGAEVEGPSDGTEFRWVARIPVSLIFP